MPMLAVLAELKELQTQEEDLAIIYKIQLEETLTQLKEAEEHTQQIVERKRRGR